VWNGTHRHRFVGNLDRPDYDKRMSRERIETESHLVELNPDMASASERTISRPSSVMWLVDWSSSLPLLPALRVQTLAESYMLHETGG